MDYVTGVSKVSGMLSKEVVYLFTQNTSHLISSLLIDNDQGIVVGVLGY